MVPLSTTSSREHIHRLGNPEYLLSSSSREHRQTRESLYVVPSREHENQRIIEWVLLLNLHLDPGNRHTLKEMNLKYLSSAVDSFVLETLVRESLRPGSSISFLHPGNTLRVRKNH